VGVWGYELIINEYYVINVTALRENLLLTRVSTHPLLCNKILIGWWSFTITSCQSISYLFTPFLVASKVHTKVHVVSFFLLSFRLFWFHTQRYVFFRFFDFLFLFRFRFIFTNFVLFLFVGFFLFIFVHFIFISFCLCLYPLYFVSFSFSFSYPFIFVSLSFSSSFLHFVFFYFYLRPLYFHFPFHFLLPFRFLELGSFHFTIKVCSFLSLFTTFRFFLFLGFVLTLFVVYFRSWSFPFIFIGFGLLGSFFVLDFGGSQILLFL
jgi:hypothetical protein